MDGSSVFAVSFEGLGEESLAVVGDFVFGGFGLHGRVMGFGEVFPFLGWLVEVYRLLVEIDPWFFGFFLLLSHSIDALLEGAEVDIVIGLLQPWPSLLLLFHLLPPGISLRLDFKPIIHAGQVLLLPLYVPFSVLLTTRLHILQFPQIHRNW